MSSLFLTFFWGPGAPILVGAVNLNPPPGDWGQSPLPRWRQSPPTRNKDVRPISFVTNQSGPYRILTDIGKLFSQTFVMPKAMIEEISLPLYSPHFGGDSFIIPNQLRKRIAAIDTNQRVQMILHEQQKIQVPSSALVIDARCVEQHLCAAFAAKLI